MRVPLLTPPVTPAPPADPPPVAQEPFCPNCAARLVVGQDWCLTCGAPAPGRLRTGPGLRSSLGVVGVTLLLAGGSVAAAYVALSSDSNRATRIIASAPPQTPPAAVAPPPPVVPAAPVTVAPVPVPGSTALKPTTLAPAPKLPPATPTPPAAVGPTARAPTAGAKPTTPAATTPTKPVAVPKRTVPAAGGPLAASSAAILLDTDAATSYNPYSLAPTSFGDPAKAIDGTPLTAWTYQLDPSTGGRTLAGLAVNLKSAQRVRSMTLSTTSPGMNVEFYGATGSEPVSITDPGWIHLANGVAIKASSKFVLNARGRPLDYLLIWITHAPPGVTSGTLGISELSVIG